VCSLRCMVEPNLLAGSVPCATRVPFCRAPLEAGQAGVSERDDEAEDDDHLRDRDQQDRPSGQLGLLRDRADGGRADARLGGADRLSLTCLDLVERLIREESIAGAEAKTLLSDPAECRAAAPTTSRRSRHAHVKPGLSSRRRGRALQCGPAGETPYAAHLGRSRSAVRLSCRNSISRLRLGSYFVRDDDHRRERVGCDMPRNTAENRRHPGSAAAAAHDDQVNSALLGECKQSSRWLARLRE
jgi:hypothetical protein